MSERVRFASMVLLGTVNEFDGTTASFEIEEIWRGPDLPGTVDIVPEPGRAYTPGERYLVFPTGAPSPLADARCSATVRWTEELSEFRPATARAPGATPAEDADLPWEWVIGLAVIGAGFIGLRNIVERRRHPEPVWDPSYSLDQEDD